MAQDSFTWHPHPAQRTWRLLLWPFIRCAFPACPIAGVGPQRLEEAGCTLLFLDFLAFPLSPPVPGIVGAPAFVVDRVFSLDSLQLLLQELPVVSSPLLSLLPCFASSLFLLLPLAL